jgi:type I restriction enzyme M protein
VRRKLLHECDVHTLLRLPTGIFYAQGVKANVLFFDRKPASEKPWTEQAVDLRPAHQPELHPQAEPAPAPGPGRVRGCYNPANRHERTPTWSEDNPDGRWRVFTYDELMARDKVNLDIFWLRMNRGRDESLEDAANLPDPDVLAPRSWRSCRPRWH